MHGVKNCSHFGVEHVIVIVLPEIAFRRQRCWPGLNLKAIGKIVFDFRRNNASWSFNPNRRTIPGAGVAQKNLCGKQGQGIFELIIDD
jgi:hypothetical protein